jgi:hypothetical protein
MVFKNFLSITLVRDLQAYRKPPVLLKTFRKPAMMCTQENSSNSRDSKTEIDQGRKEKVAKILSGFLNNIFKKGSLKI